MVLSLQRDIGTQRQKSNAATNCNVNGHARANGGPQNFDLDAAIIGGGFAGVYLLHRLREEGFNVKLIEAGGGLGGIWHWNNYPGARVDSPYPVYALSIPEVYKTWRWSEEYPGAKELQEYFKHVDKCIEVSKDTLYHTRVSKANWNEQTHKWDIECDNGTKIKATYMHCCLGFAAKRHFPDWEGLDTFQGYTCHSSFWPEEGVDVKGKKVGVVGNGATGIQIAQTTAREAGELKVFIRTPNTCLPMNKAKLDPERMEKDLDDMHRILTEERPKNVGGFLFEGTGRGILEDTPEKQQEVLKDAFDKGGFRPLFTYTDYLVDEKANRIVHDYWANRTRSRITDPVKRDILVPLEPLHPFGGKRPSLEQDYYEQMDRPHVKLVNLRELSIKKVVPEGIVTSDGELHELDILAIATGFDSLTGGFSDIDIRGIDGQKLKDKWDGPRGAMSYLGMTVSGFPNMMYTYGPHSPTAYANGPTINEVQIEWIVDVSKRMRKEGHTKIDAQPTAEEEWKQMINETHKMTLRDKVDSWYMGTNIPGKVRQALNYSAGVPMYKQTIWDVYNNDLKGFDLNKRPDEQDSNHGLTEVKETKQNIQQAGAAPAVGA